MSIIRILSIDGGGINGIVSAQVLIALEDRIRCHAKDPNAHISDYFDFVAGTSTGGILAALLLCPDSSGKPKFSARDALNLYRQNGPAIFQKSVWHRLKTGFGLLGPKYSPKGLERAAYRFFGDTKLSELIKPCLIPAYDIQRRSAVFFTQANARLSARRDFPVTQVVRSTSAAPTYFPVALATSMAGASYACIDGGVFANNPSLCAYTECSKHICNACPEKMAIFSLGNVIKQEPYPYRKARHWGALCFLEPLVDIVMDAQNQTAAYQCESLFRSFERSRHFVRIEADVTRYHDPFKMDDVAQKHMDCLRQIGMELAIENRKAIDGFAEFAVNVSKGAQ